MKTPFFTNKGTLKLRHMVESSSNQRSKLTSEAVCYYISILEVSIRSWHIFLKEFLVSSDTPANKAGMPGHHRPARQPTLQDCQNLPRKPVSEMSWPSDNTCSCGSDAWTEG